ncbi:transposase IS861 orfB [Streptococcus ratti FA-1 = DSM 20564]|uniref:Transposase IS861 orfB n=1 Tax=Streptococcus ratti FA-1 = DSM 20564 TaxID=699248 RepID=A0ABP2QX51_STRRT|nr:transposase IS861 orfB [Streptococcus ratti FA-1 = DSM 20564]EMP69772.1 transposase IS861 orfB [Streptococcus ratti FA-1 = DSM 20564]
MPAFNKSKLSRLTGFEKTLSSLEELKTPISDYIDYYNNKRITLKPKGLSPVQYRTQSLA